MEKRSIDRERAVVTDDQMPKQVQFAKANRYRSVGCQANFHEQIKGRRPTKIPDPTCIDRREANQASEGTSCDEKACVDSLSGYRWVGQGVDPAKADHPASLPTL
jgi:hypothetical protein